MNASTTDGAGFGVYVHWPFCAQKCPYCDFNSHVRFKAPDEARFLAAYKRELEASAATTGRGLSVSSIFFGGGTPSLMRPETVGGILEAIAALWTIEPGAEITIEANPGSVEADRFAGYRAAGVNRVSLGVQSLNDAELRRLGRIHSAEEARAALAIARRTFPRFSFDLIYARPGQTAQAWAAELGEALDLAGDHLSLYQLTIEPDTPFAALHKAGRLVVPEAETARGLYDLTEEMTAARGLYNYEISNYARPGEESRHNLLYWRYGTYAGIGAGAHGRLERAGDGVRLATSTIRSPEGWLEAVERQGHGFAETTPLARDEMADEMLLMGLRIGEGLDLDGLVRLTGRAPDPAVIAELVGQGLLVHVSAAGEPQRIRTTRDGRLVLDWIVGQLSASFRSDNAPATASDRALSSA